MALYNFPVVPQPTEHTHPPQDQGVVTEAGRTVENFILSKGEAVTGLFFLRDTPGKRLPCLHEQAFAGQRTANGFDVSCRGKRLCRELQCLSEVGFDPNASKGMVF